MNLSIEQLEIIRVALANYAYQISIKDYTSGQKERAKKEYGHLDEIPVIRKIIEASIEDLTEAQNTVIVYES